jgi:putative ABC transport system ATP-binding protein
MAAYAKRIVHFVDGVVHSDTLNPQPRGLRPATTQAATATAEVS